jgi:hypothetical protein
MCNFDFNYTLYLKFSKLVIHDSYAGTDSLISGSVSITLLHN